MRINFVVYCDCGKKLDLSSECMDERSDDMELTVSPCPYCVNNAKPKWITPGEMMPDEWTPILICSITNHVAVARYKSQHDQWSTDDGINYHGSDMIAGWMPLPAPPEEE